MRTVNLFASGLLLFLSFFVHSVNAQNCTLPAPADMTVSFPNQTSARFDWTPVTGAWGYKIQVLNQGTAGVTTYSVQAPATHLTIQTDPNNSYQVTLRSSCSANYDSDQLLIRYFIGGDYIIVADVIPYESCINSTFEHLFETINAGQEYSNFSIIQINERYIFKFDYFNGSSTETVNGYIFRDISDHVGFGIGTAGWIAEETPLDVKQVRIYKLGKNSISPFLKLSLHSISNATGMGGPLFIEALGSGYSNFELRKCARSGEPGLETSNTTASNALSSFQVAPNPFADELNIQMGEVPTEAFQIRLFNTAGQLCLSKDVSKEDAHTNNLALPTEGLAPGMYYLHLSTGNGETVVKKVVKM